MMMIMMMLAMIYPTFTPASTSSVVSSAFDTSHAPQLPPPPAKRLVDALFSLGPIYFHPAQFIFTWPNLSPLGPICCRLIFTRPRTCWPNSIGPQRAYFHSAHNQLCQKVCHRNGCMGPNRLECCAFVVAMQTFLDALQSGYYMDR